MNKMTAEQEAHLAALPFEMPDPQTLEDGANLGWVNDPEAVKIQLMQMPMPYGEDSLPKVQEGKDVFLHKYIKQLIGKDAPKGPQGIGDCVSWGFSGGGDILQAVDILINGKAIEYEELATEVIYALSRCEVGKQWNDYSDGSVGAWAAQALTKYGHISRPHLTRLGVNGDYSPKRAKEWGAKGLPDNLEPAAKEHLFKTTTLVTSFEQMAAAIQNGYPVVICSNQGFTMTRDSQGFCSPRGTWYHCMFVSAVRWDRPGGLIHQSWGPNTPNGPIHDDQPDNTFWADEKVLDRMLKQRDSFAISQFVGYPEQDLTWRH